MYVLGLRTKILLYSLQYLPNVQYGEEGCRVRVIALGSWLSDPKSKLLIHMVKLSKRLTHAIT